MPAQGAQINGITMISRAIEKYDSPYDSAITATIAMTGIDNTIVSRTPEADPFNRGSQLAQLIGGSKLEGSFGFMISGRPI